MSILEPSRADAGGDERKHPSSVPGDRDPDVRQDREAERNPRKKSEQPSEEDVQPGTAEPGKSWQSRIPNAGDEDDVLNESLKDSFPASDPPQSAQPGVTGWDLTDEEKKKRKSAA